MIKVEGIKESAAFLRAVGRGDWRKEVGKDYGQELVAKTKPYVSAPTGSRYRRTMALSRGWYHRADKDKVEVGNRARNKSGYYSGFVQQRDTQAWMHRQHGWHTIEDRFESAYMRKYLERRVNMEIEALSKKYGTG